MGFYGKNLGGKEVVRKTRAKDVLWNERPPLYHIKPCARCGASQENKQVYTVYFGFCAGKDGWKVICRNCGHCSDRFFPAEKEAINAWNGDDEK